MKDFLPTLVASGVATSAVGLVGTADRILWEGAAGEARPAVPVEADSRYDFASLTKPFTATLALALDADGTLPLAARISEVWPEADRRLGRRRLEELLRHRAGVAAWAPLYQLCRSREDVTRLVLGGGLPVARAETYSDLDYLLWGMTAEKVTGQPLTELMRARVLAPLGLDRVEPAPGDRPEVVRSPMDTGKEADLAAKQGLAIPTLPPPPIGRPQDGNVRFLMELPGFGPLAGHAGLFGRARDLWVLATEWLAPGRLLKQEHVSAALTGGRKFALGWWRRTLRGSAGKALPSSSVGHTGFAGNSFWIDRENGRIYVLLTSRIDPRCDMNRWRRGFHVRAARVDG
ncbi:MAG TPA: serine hydrolase domain-containing protein [Thermoanaerobaculia bacterium]|nr:serine hydrolase domain-containing protein [Thermoanaerobaculia bacterium]